MLIAQRSKLNWNIFVFQAHETEEEREEKKNIYIYIYIFDLKNDEWNFVWRREKERETERIEALPVGVERMFW
jgi:hypothetical protein